MDGGRGIGRDRDIGRCTSTGIGRGRGIGKCRGRYWGSEGLVTRGAADAVKGRSG